MTPVLIFLVWILLVAASVLAIALRFARENEAAARRTAEELKHCAHHNLRAIRGRLSYGFPESCAVCDALEEALKLRCRVDLERLEQRVVTLRRIHNAALLDSAGKGRP